MWRLFIVLGVGLLALPAPALAGAGATRSVAPPPSEVAASDVPAEQRAGKEMRRTWRDYRPGVELTRDDVLWAQRQLKRARVAQVFGLEFMVAGLGSGFLGQLTGVMVPDPRVHLGFSIATTGLLALGGFCLLQGASYVREIHRRWRTGPLWAGRITGIVLLSVAVGASLAAVGGSIGELASGQPSMAPAMGNGFGFMLGIPAIIVLAVDFTRHRKPIQALEFVREKTAEVTPATRPRPVVVPTLVPVQGGAAVGLAGAW